jgi:hypothetical protein
VRHVERIYHLAMAIFVISFKIYLMTTTILRICPLLLLFLTFSTHANFKNLTYKLSANSVAEIRDSRFVQARIWSLRPQLKARYKLMDSLVFRTELEGYFESGSNDSLFIDEYRPRREIFLNEGRFTWKPFQMIKVDFGAINQEGFNSPLFLTETAFAGAKETLQLLFMGMKVKLFAQQTIANNQNLSARLNSVDEGTPKFYSETVEANYEASNFEFKFAYSLFRFNNLSRAVAHESRFLGNSVSGTGQDNAVYLYEFSGHNTYARLQFKLAQLNFHLSGHYTHNNEAPNNRADAIWFMAGLGINRYFIFYENFETESDVTPAFYNSKFYGHNNFKGHCVGVFFKTEKSKLSLNARYIKATVLQPSLYQNDFTGTQVSVGKEF